MTAVSTTPPWAANSLAQLISGSFDGLFSPATAAANSAAASPASQDNSGPASFVTLSEQAKAAAAARIQSDEVAAERLQAFVAAHRVNHGGDSGQTNTADSSQNSSGANVLSTGTQLTATAEIDTIVTQIQTVADANQPQPFQTFTPTKNLSNSVTIDGYTVNLSTNALTQYYGVELSGNGVQAYSKHFGPDDGGGGASAVPPGVTVGTATVGNNEALEAVTITQNAATASSASVTSANGSASASEVDASSSSITFLVNYATGQISVQEKAVSVSARSAQISAPGSTLSALA